MGMAGLAAIAAVVVLTAFRMPVALALLVAGGAGLVWTGGLDQAWAPVAGVLWKPDLWLVPLVLMLGNTAFHAGFSTRVHDAAAVMLQGRRGGLALAGALGSAGFAATSGSSLGCAATMARVAVPGMLAAGYDPRLAGGSVAMGSTLGALLPPSMPLILWALLSDIPAGTMFLAGLLPAALSLAGVTLVILWWVRRDEAAAPLPQPLDISRAAALHALWPAPVLFALLLGGVAWGGAGPLVAMALCLALTLGLGLAQHRLAPESLWSALRETLRQTLAILLLVLAARLFLAFLEQAGLPAMLADWTAPLPRLALLALLALACWGLALVIEPVPMLVLLLPVGAAMAQQWGQPQAWAGIALLKLAEVAMVLPPFGLIVMVVAATVRTMAPRTIFAGVARFLFVDLLVLAAIVLFPALTGWP